MRKFYSPFLFILFFSCSAKIYYVGQASIATKKADVYINESAIKRNYNLVGQGYLNVWATHSKPDKIQKLRKKQPEKRVQIQ